MCRLCTVLRRQGKSLKQFHTLILLLNNRHNLVQALGLRYRKLPISFKGLIEYFRIRVRMANSSKLLRHNMVILEVKEAVTTPTASNMLVKTLMQMQEALITIIAKPMLRLKRRTVVTTSISPICLRE